MPSVTPLNNIKLQSSLNLNNQLLLNTNRAKAYTLNNLGSGSISRDLNASDIGCLLFVDGTLNLTINNNITGISSGDSVFVAAANIIVSGPVSIRDSGDYSANSGYNIFQLIYLGANTWLYINTN
jgi:hypothetical protein